MNKKFTDMYLIAALLAYGFDLVDENRTNLKRQEFYFNDEKKFVYVVALDGDFHTELSTLEDVEKYFRSKRLLYPGSYPDVLKNVKQDIVSHKQDGNE